MPKIHDRGFLALHDTMDINPVRAATLGVVKKAQNVKINREKIQELAKKWTEEKLVVPVWPKEFHLKTNDEQKMLDYLIILDSLNFCFWNKKERWHFNYMGKKYNGYFALALALKKFFEENRGKGSLEYFRNIPFYEFKEILQGGKNLFFLKKRWQIAKKVSSALIKKHGGSGSFILSAEQKFSLFVPKVLKDLPFFNDIGRYRGEKVCF